MLGKMLFIESTFTLVLRQRYVNVQFVYGQAALTVAAKPFCLWITKPQLRLSESFIPYKVHCETQVGLEFMILKSRATTSDPYIN